MKGLVGPHAQQVEVCLLAVAEKEVLADGYAQHFADGRAFLHGVGGIAGHPVVVDAQGFQNTEGGVLLGEQFALGAGAMVQGRDFHRVSVLIQNFLAGTVDVAGANGQDQVAGTGQFPQLLCRLFQGGAVDGTGDIAA